MENNKIIGSMIKDGYFGNLNTENEIDKWNILNRIRKAITWLLNNTGPSWFLNDLKNYQPDKNKSNQMVLET